MTATAVTIEQVMAGLEDRLNTIPGLRTVPYEPDSIAPPCAFVQLPREYAYDFTMGRGSDALRFTITVMVSRTSDRGSVKKLAAHMNPSGEQSIKAAVDDSSTPTKRALGGLVHFARVARVVNVGVQRVGDVAYLAADFEVEVKL